MPLFFFVKKIERCFFLPNALLVCILYSLESVCQDVLVSEICGAAKKVVYQNLRSATTVSLMPAHRLDMWNVPRCGWKPQRI